MKVMIIGGGKVGTYLAGFLTKEGHTVKLVEQRREEIERLHTEIGAEHIVFGSGTDPSILEANGIRQMDVVAAVTGDDETNLVVTNLARYEFFSPRTIARVNNPKNTWMFTSEMGVDVALNQAELMGRMILEEMSVGDMMTLLKLRKGQYSIVEEKVDPDSSLIGKTLSSITLPEECVIVAILRREGMVIPHGNFEFRAADEVIALVHSSKMDELAILLGAPRK